MPDSTRRQRLLGILKTITDKPIPADDGEVLLTTQNGCL